MSIPQRPQTLLTLKTLYGAAACCVLAHGSAGAATHSGLLPRGPLRAGLAIVLAVVAGLVLVRVLLKIASRRTDPNLLDPASELTTLTFPPSRNARPRVQRAK